MKAIGAFSRPSTTVSCHFIFSWLRQGPVSMFNRLCASDQMPKIDLDGFAHEQY
jgi:hypothetical protein